MAEIIGVSPPALAAKPEPLAGWGSYLEAFSVLCGARAVGLGGPLPIPLSEIESYCRLTGWRDPEAAAELIAIVQAMDAVYLKVTARRREVEAAVRRPDGEVRRRARAGADGGERPDLGWPEGRTQK